MVDLTPTFKVSPECVSSHIRHPETRPGQGGPLDRPWSSTLLFVATIAPLGGSGVSEFQVGKRRTFKIVYSFIAPISVTVVTLWANLGAKCILKVFLNTKIMDHIEKMVRALPSADRHAHNQQLTEAVVVQGLKGLRFRPDLSLWRLVA